VSTILDCVACLSRLFCNPGAGVWFRVLVIGRGGRGSLAGCRSALGRIGFDLGCGQLGKVGVCFLDLGGGIGFDWVCFGFVFSVSWEGEIFVNLFGAKGWVGFWVFEIGFVLRERVMVS